MLYTLATVLPMTVCLFWTVLLLLDHPGRDKARKVFTGFGIVSTVLYTCHLVYFSGQGSWPFECLYSLCTLSVYPLYNYYIRCLIHKRRRMDHFAPWLIPGVLISLWGLYSGISGGNMVRVQEVTMLCIPVITLFSSINAAIGLQRFRKRAQNYYADTEGKTLDPIFIMMVLLMVMAVLSSTAALIGREQFLGSDLLVLPSGMCSLLLFCIFYVGYKTDIPAEALLIPEKEEQSEADSSIAEGQQQVLMEKIEAQMEKQQLFRNKGLLISDVAEAVGSNRTYVSNSINQLTGMTFSDYINTKRVAYVKALMDEQPDMPLASMADLAGYSDRTSFYRGFKKATGLSPSEFLQKRG